MRCLLLLALTACSTHNRVTAGPTLGTRHGTTAGGELGIGNVNLLGLDVTFGRHNGVSKFSAF